MKKVLLAPVGNCPDAIFVGLREFPCQQVVLLHSPERAADAMQLKSDLERFRISTTSEELTGNMLERVFEIVAKLKSADNELLVNISAGDCPTNTSLLTAAFVHGVKAIAVVKDQVMQLPILPYSYYHILTDKKMDILKLLASKGHITLQELSQKTRMSAPLMSYHVNGNKRSEGLLQLGLVEKVAENGRKGIRISGFGKLLVKGYQKT